MSQSTTTLPSLFKEGMFEPQARTGVVPLVARWVNDFSGMVSAPTEKGARARARLRRSLPPSATRICRRGQQAVANGCSATKLLRRFPT